MKVAATFYPDTNTWETEDGLCAHSLAKLSRKLPEGTVIDGYFPCGVELRNQGKLGKEPDFKMTALDVPTSVSLPKPKPPRPAKVTLADEQRIKYNNARTFRPAEATKRERASYTSDEVDPNKGKTIVWTDDKLKELRKLVSAGLTAKQIGLELGCSRNAVIGKCHRKGVQLQNHRGWVEPRHQQQVKRGSGM